jgi:hypothetical protein
MNTDTLNNSIIICKNIDVHIDGNVNSDIYRYDSSNNSDSSDIDSVELAG